MEEDGYFLDGKKIDDIVIIRHGTERDTLLAAYLTPMEKETLTNLKAAQKINTVYNNTKLLWGYSSLFSLLNTRPEEKFAFLAPETDSICSSFISVFADTMKYNKIHVQHGKSFRICLHRIVSIENELQYQQITPYFGSNEPDARDIGRLYNIDVGIVGLAIKHGIAFKMSNQDSSLYEEVVRLLNLEEKHQSYKGSAMAIPVLGTLKNGVLATNLVCFLEAEDKDFFTQEAILQTIYVIEGFINYIKNAVQSFLWMYETDLTPMPIKEQEPISELQKNSCFGNISQAFEFLEPLKTPLKFEEFYSFDITFRGVVNNLQLYRDNV